MQSLNFIEPDKAKIGRFGLIERNAVDWVTMTTGLEHGSCKRFYL